MRNHGLQWDAGPDGPGGQWHTKDKELLSLCHGASTLRAPALLTDWTAGMCGYTASSGHFWKRISKFPTARPSSISSPASLYSQPQPPSFLHKVCQGVSQNTELEVSKIRDAIGIVGIRWYPSSRSLTTPTGVNRGVQRFLNISTKKKKNNALGSF